MVAEPFGPAAAFVLTDHQVDAIGGGKRVALRATVANRSARLRLAVMGGENVIGLSKAARASTSASRSATTSMSASIATMLLGTSTCPPSSTAAWAEHPDIVAAFQKLSYTHQREYAEWVGSAKQQATRDRRAGRGSRDAHRRPHAEIDRHRSIRRYGRLS